MRTRDVWPPEEGQGHEHLQALLAAGSAGKLARGAVRVAGLDGAGQDQALAGGDDVDSLGLGGSSESRETAGSRQRAGDGQIDDVLHRVGLFTTRSCESGGRGFQAVAPMRP